MLKYSLSFFRYKSITGYTEVTRYITLLQGKVILLRNTLK